MTARRPKRIQLKRAKGWRLPHDAAIVSRPTKWGNPFRIGVDGTREECVRQFGEWIVGDDRRRGSCAAPLASCAARTSPAGAHPGPATATY